LRQESKTAAVFRQQAKPARGGLRPSFATAKREL